MPIAPEYRNSGSDPSDHPGMTGRVIASDSNFKQPGRKTFFGSSLRANGSRECAPDDSSAKQSIAQHKERMDCFVASPRNDGKLQVRDLAAGFARGLACSFRPLEYRGRRECRAPDAPAAACVLVESTRVSHHGHTGNTRHSPRNGFNGFLRALPGDRAFLPPSPAENLLPRNLTPASGRQDHTTSPSADQRIRQSAISVHRIPRPTSVTIAKRPS